MIDLLLKSLLTNKISSVEVADALHKSGVLPEVLPLNVGKYVAGQVHYVCTWHGSNWPLHDQIRNAPPNSVVYVDTFDCATKAVLGDIVCKQLFYYQNITGLVVNGFVRDVHRIKKESYPVWAKGFTPLGCINSNIEPSVSAFEYCSLMKSKFSGSILVADDSGVTLIPNEKITSDLLSALEAIELQEDIWYYCLDTLKMNSFDIICLKRYLTDPATHLPDILKDRLKNFNP